MIVEVLWQSGSIGVKSEELETITLHSTHVLFSKDIVDYKNSVNEFWNFEVLEISEKETPCYNHYLEDFFKKSENSYTVFQLFTKNHPLMHDHCELNKKRLLKFTNNLNMIRNS